jgi:hypothetical protein
MKTEPTTGTGTGENLHTPSRADINRLAATAIGYRVQDIRNAGQFGPCADLTDAYILVCNGWHSDGAKSPSEAWAYCPDFCAPDCPYSLMAQLLAKVEAEGKTKKAWTYLSEKVSPYPTRYSNLPVWAAMSWVALTLSPQSITIVCLRSLGVYPENWSEPTP